VTLKYVTIPVTPTVDIPEDVVPNPATARNAVVPTPTE